MTEARGATDAATIARNVSTRWLAIVVEMLLGVVVLPYNVSHLGRSAYGLWMLTASITSYFSVLDLGYSGALVKFVARYRAKQDSRALNEVLSTTFYLFTALGLLAYGVAVVVAVHLGGWFHLQPDQARVGRIILLVISCNVAAGMAFTVFGGIVNGFQRIDLNSSVSIASSVLIASVNVLVLAHGGGLVPLVIATTAVRLGSYVVYRSNAYRVFPELRLHPSLVNRARLRELTGFSAYLAVIDWARRLNYSADAVVIAAFMNTGAVALWSVAQRVAEATIRLTIQLSDVLFPTVVDDDTSNRPRRLQAILLVGTRLSLATVMPIAGVCLLMAGPLVRAWVGPSFHESAAVLQLLSLTVMFRIGSATATTVLKAGGRHQLVAWANVAAAVVNITASIVLVNRLGLVGVAVGTLVPVAAASALVIFPAGCRRVGVSIGRALREAVWPAAWPAAVMACYVQLTRPMAGDSLVGVGAEMLSAVALYALTFLFGAVTPIERRSYLSKALALKVVAHPLAHMSGVPEGA